MKTKNFILVFIVIIMAMILTFTLQCLFSEIAGDFGLSCGMLFLSIFFLFSYKNALMPMERGGFAINMTKRYYQSRDELPKYQKLCKILFIVTISFGTLSFVKGMGNVLFHYVKLFLAQYIASFTSIVGNSPQGDFRSSSPPRDKSILVPQNTDRFQKTCGMDRFCNSVQKAFSDKVREGFSIINFWYFLSFS